MAAIFTQVGHFYSGEVGQFYIGADTPSFDAEIPAREEQYGSETARLQSASPSVLPCEAD